MARNTQVEADHDAPAVTQILARFVATHPSRGWSEAVDHQAHRTFLNWVGCAVGAARHESAEAALAGMKMLQPAPQSGILGRAERVDMASAALVNGITSHTFDFDDTHLRTIIHPAIDAATRLRVEGVGAERRAGGEVQRLSRRRGQGSSSARPARPSTGTTSSTARTWGRCGARSRRRWTARSMKMPQT
jgi:hypothetical protein